MAKITPNIWLESMFYVDSEYIITSTKRDMHKYNFNKMLLLPDQK